jgi:hypothetical protein
VYDLTKQPKWVQEEIASLKSRLRDSEHRLATLKKLAKITTGYAGDMEWSRPVGVEVNIDDMRTYPQGTRVSFKQGRRRGYITVRQLAHDLDTLEIYSAEGRLQVVPKSGNVIEVTGMERCD